MLNLYNVTLICVDTINPQKSIEIMKKCSNDIVFGDKILVTIPSFRTDIVNLEYINPISWTEYNDVILHLNKYIKTDFALLIQNDGFIVNPTKFLPEFLDYDCIGAPWPDQKDWLQLQTVRLQKCFTNKTRVGNGGFTLRSKKFWELIDSFDSCNGLGEDSFVCCENYEFMIQNGIKYAPPELAIKFSVENPVKELGIYDWRDTRHVDFNTNNSFGFHGNLIRDRI